MFISKDILYRAQRRPKKKCPEFQCLSRFALYSSQQKFSLQITKYFDSKNKYKKNGEDRSTDTENRAARFRSLSSAAIKP